ncbi:MAG: hypothetical protein U0V04_20455 [Spirosomataceae bacterium]
MEKGGSVYIEVEYSTRCKVCTGKTALLALVTPIFKDINKNDIQVRFYFIFDSPQNLLNSKY